MKILEYSKLFADAAFGPAIELILVTKKGNHLGSPFEIRCWIRVNWTNKGLTRFQKLICSRQVHRNKGGDPTFLHRNPEQPVHSGHGEGVVSDD